MTSISETPSCWLGSGPELLRNPIFCDFPPSGSAHGCKQANLKHGNLDAFKNNNLWHNLREYLFWIGCNQEIQELEKLASLNTCDEKCHFTHWFHTVALSKWNVHVLTRNWGYKTFFHTLLNEHESFSFQ